MLRYMRALEAKDLSLTHSMIPLGSCTMKLNATSEMEPGHLAGVRPHAPLRARGAVAGLRRRSSSSSRAGSAEITGFAGISLMPNAGSQGEYAGLLVIRATTRREGQGHRNVCLIPASAHGTNPASAVMAGFQVVVVKTDENGNVDVGDLEGEDRRAQGRARAR